MNKINHFSKGQTHSFLEILYSVFELSWLLSRERGWLGLKEELGLAFSTQGTYKLYAHDIQNETTNTAGFSTCFQDGRGSTAGERDLDMNQLLTGQPAPQYRWLPSYSARCHE